MTKKTQKYLRDNSNGFSEAFHVHKGDILVINGDAAILWLIEAVQQSHNGGLPASNTIN